MSTTVQLTNMRGLGAIATVATACVMITALAGLAGCAADEPVIDPTDERKGFGMGGVEQTIAISAAAVNDMPEPWDLSEPESAVRSYLDWVSYAYRIGESDEATPTQSPYQVVRTDGYVQANLQKQRLLDQTLQSITFGESSEEQTRALVPAREEWTYRYVSTERAGETLEGPFEASYETTYTLVKTEQGWVVDDIAVKSLSEVQ